MNKRIVIPTLLISIFAFESEVHATQQIKIVPARPNTNYIKIARSTHERCLEAKDYKGCMQYNSQPSQTGKRIDSPKKDKQCYQDRDGKTICIAGNGVDVFGYPKQAGWTSIYNPRISTLFYIDPQVYKVKVRGEFGRYVETRMITRYRQAATAAIPGTTTVVGQAQTNCYSTGYSVNCNTTPPATISTPGIAAQPERIISELSSQIIDCKERTAAKHIGSSTKSRWEKWTDADAPAYANACSRDILELTASSFDKYE